ncbi:DUF6660 family protein [Pedobacter sp. L105]|uniref:DUF6660 family protein n=1 Tax=Pedobacter sp. L105 TaxID=1641871 RepID=UPI00131DEBB1|nr:DUF6660 family protein [Pedobacter sp. L105]
MKILALLLSIMVLTLTAVPCCKAEGNPAHHHDQKANKNTEEKEDCCKNCSPFYVCASCVGFTISNYSIIGFTVYLKLIKHNFSHLTAELTQPPSRLWQPPRLS